MGFFGKRRVREIISRFQDVLLFGVAFIIVILDGVIVYTFYRQLPSIWQDYLNGSDIKTKNNALKVLSVMLEKQPIAIATSAVVLDGENHQEYLVGLQKVEVIYRNEKRINLSLNK